MGVITPSAQIPQNLKFTGEGGLHPCKYLEALEAHFALCNVPVKNKMLVVRQTLEKAAADWGDAEGVWNNTSFSEWKERFIQRWWNRDKQLRTKIQLISSRYDPSKEGPMLGYVERVVARLRTCDLGMPENEMIEILISHFSDDVQDLLNTVGIRTLADMRTRLAALDTTRTANVNRTVDREYVGAPNGMRSGRPPPWPGREGERADTQSAREGVRGNDAQRDQATWRRGQGETSWPVERSDDRGYAGASGGNGVRSRPTNGQRVVRE